MKINLNLVFYAVLAAMPAIFPFSSSAGEERDFDTSYCSITYPDTKTLGDFFFRIGGRRFNFEDDTALARSRADRIIDRVMAILGMYPKNFKVRVRLYSEYSLGSIASYDSKTDVVTVYANKVTDGVFAHEVAHAVICKYFHPNPPGKAQEILTQYVDKHLWDDY
ncbi:MAG: hypothetical protein HQL30_00690 [Candidatus Omnitrophica bacterium]|nr:hypothetical protein [Candidatus Omnitrophota bacterium]